MKYINQDLNLKNLCATQVQVSLSRTQVSFAAIKSCGTIHRMSISVYKKMN